MFASPDVDPEKPKPIGMAVAGNEYIGRVIAGKVHLDISGHIIPAEFTVHPQAQLGIDRQQASLTEKALDLIRKRDRPEIRRGRVARVSAAPDTREIDET